MRRLPKVYLAGPMRGHDDHNWPAFDEAAQRLAEMGFDVVSPADLDRANGVRVDDEEMSSGMLRKCLARDIDALAGCDMIYLMPGWKTSRGAKAEVAFAKAIGMPIVEIKESQFD